MNSKYQLLIYLETKHIYLILNIKCEIWKTMESIYSMPIQVI